MKVTDEVIEWYLTHFVMPRAQVLDTPGFIYFNISGKSPVFARQLVMPESFFCKLEEKIIKELGTEGKQKLYSLGKKFGYRFSSTGRFFKRGEVDDEKLKQYFKIVDKFIEGTYASKFEHELNLAGPAVKVKLNKFVVIDSIGYGFFLPLGGGAGIISWLLNDTSIEGIMLPKEGEDYALLYAPRSVLEKEYNQILFENNLSGLELETDYIKMNTPVRIQRTAYSFKQLIDANLFSYNKGIITRGNQRYFLIEASAIYLIEQELEKENRTKKILDACAFESGKEIMAGNEKYQLKDVVNILTAFGWGDVLIINNNERISVSIDHYPWTKFSDLVEFKVIKNFLEGALSEVCKRRVQLSSAKVDYFKKLQGNLSVYFMEEQ